TDVGAGGGVAIPGWTLAHNDTDPDLTDSIGITNVGGGSSGSATEFLGAADFTDDATLGGSFTYQAFDGIAASANTAIVTVANQAVGALTGTSGDDILVSGNNGETLDGGAGNDILIGTGGNHILTGGTGDDIFAFQQPSDPPNTIADFNTTSE